MNKTLKHSKKHITKCKKCGNTSFYVNEVVSWDAVITNNYLEVYKNRTSGIEGIFCKKCGTEYSENDFKTIEFC